MINLDDFLFNSPDLTIILDSLEKPSEARIESSKNLSQEVIDDIVSLNRYPRIHTRCDWAEGLSIHITLPPIDAEQSRLMIEQIGTQLEKEHQLEIERLVREGNSWKHNDCKIISTFNCEEFKPDQEQAEKITELLKGLRSQGLIIQWASDLNQRCVIFFTNGGQKTFGQSKELNMFLEGMKWTMKILKPPFQANQHLISAPPLSTYKTSDLDSGN